METKEVYKINTLLALVLIAVYAFLMIRFEYILNGLLYFAIAILFIQAISEKIAYYIAFSWMKFGKVLGAVQSKILLSILFLFIVVPIGLLKKKKIDNSTSNWINAPKSTVDFNKMG